MKKHFLAFIVVATSFIGALAYADFDQGHWKWRSPIEIGTQSGPNHYVKLPIPRNVSTLARPDLADLRVISSNGMADTEVPYQLVIESEEVRRAYVSSALRDLSTKDGETMFILDLGGNGTIHDHLVINTGTKNFKRPVSVYASDTALHHGDAGWRLLSSNSYIYNYYDQSLGFNAGRSDVYYPESTSRYLRIVIGKGEGSDVSVGSAQVLRVLSREAKKNQMFEHVSIVQNTKEHTTEITADLGGEGVATRKMSLLTDAKDNFSRRVVMQGSNDGVSWTMLGQGYVFMLNTPLFTGSELSITYPESKKRYIRAVVFNEDNAPVSWKDTVSLEGVARSIVFEVVPGMATHTLYYGNVNTNAPRYDIARFFQYFEGTLLPEVLLGDVVMNGAYIPPEAPAVPFTERNKNLLNGALILLAAVVGVMLISYLKKLKLAKNEPSS